MQNDNLKFKINSSEAKYPQKQIAQPSGQVSRHGGTSEASA